MPLILLGLNSAGRVSFRVGNFLNFLWYIFMVRCVDVIHLRGLIDVGHLWVSNDIIHLLNLIDGISIHNSMDGIHLRDSIDESLSASRQHPPLHNLCNMIIVSQVHIPNSRYDYHITKVMKHLMHGISLRDSVVCYPSPGYDLGFDRRYPSPSFKDGIHLRYSIDGINIWVMMSGIHHRDIMSGIQGIHLWVSINVLHLRDPIDEWNLTLEFDG